MTDLRQKTHEKLGRELGVALQEGSCDRYSTRAYQQHEIQIQNFHEFNSPFFLLSPLR